MKKFNRKLSQLEAIYQVAKPVVKSQNPMTLSSSIQIALENSNIGVDYTWFQSLAKRDPKKATTFAQNLLQESGELVSRKSILESIQIITQDR